MKRRDFITQGTAGAFGAGLAGCSAFRHKDYTITEAAFTPIDFEKKVPKPKGTMPMDEIGTTGIKVSKFGFGSHMRKELVKYEKVRERLVREAYDLGVNFFDVYDVESRIFQYEPMGRHLASVLHDVVISITMYPLEGLTVEQEMERDLRLFRRDYIDLVRLHAWTDSQDETVIKNQAGHRWEWWEKLFKFKEKGYIRAVGVPIHNRENLIQPLAELPIDYVFLPYNFYHNWYRLEPHDFDATLTELRTRGIGIITMKPFLGDRLVTPFRKIATQYDTNGEINFNKACLRYIQNSANYKMIDSTLAGMYNPFHVYENIDAFFNPEMSDEERNLLSNVRKGAKIIDVVETHLPEHYRFLDDWAPGSWDDSDLFDLL